MKVLFAILALLLVEVAFSDKASIPDETLDDANSQEHDVKRFEGKPAPDSELIKLRRRPPVACRPWRRNRVRAYLLKKAKAFRSLGVRLVHVPRRMQRRLRRYGKIKIRRRRNKARHPSNEMCRERPGPMTYTLANSNGNLAYVTQGVECAESLCNVRLSPDYSLTMNGRCVLRTTKVVVPVYIGCSKVSTKTIKIGCCCKCRMNNRYG